MKNLRFLASAFMALFFGITLFAQDIFAEEGSFGVDETNKIIVWHQENLKSFLEKNRFESIKFDKTYNLKSASKKLTYNEGHDISNSDTYTLYITKLPLVNISVISSKLNSSQKIPGYFTFYHNGNLVKSNIGIRHRGNLSLSFAKKSFDLEFWLDITTEEQVDVKFLDMRSDDDWILDAMFNEPLRIRSFIASELWLKIHAPYYKKNEPNAVNGFKTRFVEVFKNNKYYGLYQLMESVDKKQLKLKDNDNKSVYGELFKANSYSGGPNFAKSPDSYNNLFPHWNGWKAEYPIVDYNSEFKNLFDLQSLVVKGTDESFKNNIGNQVNLTNCIDYYLFINTLRASDNLGKNYYLAKYDKDEPYFLVPWDLDGVFGVIQDGKNVRGIKDVLTNGLFNRLLKLNPEDYRENAKSRWVSLRKSEFKTSVIISRIDKIYNQFNSEKLYEREHLVWKNKLSLTSNETHYKYLKTWLEERLAFLDTYFESL